MLPKRIYSIFKVNKFRNTQMKKDLQSQSKNMKEINFFDKNYTIIKSVRNYLQQKKTN